MRPAFLDQMSWEMAEVYGAVTDEILINLAHYFPYYNQKDFPRSSITYQADMLAQLGQVNKETMRIIRRNLQGASPALKRMLEQVIIDSVQAINPPLVQAVQKNIFAPPSIPIVEPNQMRAFQLYYQQAADKLNLVNTVMLESTQQAYQATVADIAARVQATQTALDIGAGETITGVSTWNKATQHAITRLQRDGITGFIDHAGHRWSAEAYVAMDIRTTVYNTGRAAVWETNQSFGNDLYQVSYHNGARPLCYPWQNKVISATDMARTVVDLDGNEVQVYAQSETTYGQAAGLFGVNCKHYPNPFIPGVSVIRGEPQDQKANDRTYEESQYQRSLERKIREDKRDLLMLKAQGAPEELIEAQTEKVRADNATITEFCDKTGRARHRDREGVYTKRTFPAAETYDVTQFVDDQRRMINSFYQRRGAQQGYTFGQMAQTATTPPKAFNSVAEFDREIARIRAERQAAFDSENYDKAKTDKLLTDIFELEDRKKAFIAQQEINAINASKTTVRPDNEQLVLKQFDRFDTSKRTDSQMLAQVNPNYGENTRAWTYNCQRTVIAQELVYRGYDVMAMPYNPKDPIGDVMWNALKNPREGIVNIESKKTFTETVEKSFAGWGDGSRAIIRVKWNEKNGGNGHFIFARNVKGHIIYTDPQSNEVLDIAETVSRTTQGRNRMWIMRVDNKEVNENIVYAVKNRGD